MSKIKKPRSNSPLANGETNKSPTGSTHITSNDCGGDCIGISMKNIVVNGNLMVDADSANLSGSVDGCTHRETCARSKTGAQAFAECRNGASLDVLPSVTWIVSCYSMISWKFCLIVVFLGFFEKGHNATQQEISLQQACTDEEDVDALDISITAPTVHGRASRFSSSSPRIQDAVLAQEAELVSRPSSGQTDRDAFQKTEQRVVDENRSIDERQRMLVLSRWKLDAAYRTSEEAETRKRSRKRGGP